MRRGAAAIVLLAAMTWVHPALRAQDAGTTRRLSRVPVPTGPSGRAEDLYTGSYALLVGVSRYDKPVWPSLGSIPRELADFKSALADLGFSVDEISNPTGDELRRGVEDFIRRYGYKPGARLLFFFSGHGYTLDQGRRGYFVPRDAPDPSTDEAGFRSVALTMDQVATWARNLTVRHALFAFDSCFSGTVFRTREPVVPQPITALVTKKVREFLSAGDAGEPVPAQSVFTPTLTRGLRGGADLNRDGFVTGTELGNWIQAQVIAYGTRQTPQFGKLRDPEFDEGDLVFAVPTAAPAIGTSEGPALSRGSGDLGRREELALWEAIADTESIAAFEDYLRRYPSGLFKIAAEERLRRLRARATSVAPAAPPAGAGFKLRSNQLDAASADDLDADCSAGHAAACSELGIRYRDGRGVAKDEARAVALYQRGCDGGSASGCTKWGFMYANGRGVAKDEARAVALYQRACDAGDAAGCANWGFMYSNGRGVAKDEARAVALYQRGCEGGNAVGCTNWGFMYENGRGVAKDEPRAVALYQRGCERGNAVGCTNWGFMYENGRGVAKDDARAVALYQRGCEAGDARGCTNWGTMYANGRGVAKDEARAVSLYRRGCEGGNALGCRNLAARYESGSGIQSDRQRALEFYRRACGAGDSAACDSVKRLGGA